MGWQLSCGLAPYMKEHDQRKLWNALKTKQAKTYKPTTVEDVMERYGRKKKNDAGV